MRIHLPLPTANGVWELTILVLICFGLCWTVDRLRSPRTGRARNVLVLALRDAALVLSVIGVLRTALTWIGVA